MSKDKIVVDGVTYIREEKKKKKFDTKKVSLEVDRDCANLIIGNYYVCGINDEGKLLLYQAVDEKTGLCVDEYGQIEVKN